MSRRAFWLAAATAAVLGLAAWSSIRRGGGDVPTAVVAKGPFERRIVAEGNLEAAKATPVTAPIDAQRQLKVAWLVPDGTRVRLGDVVVRFDPADVQRELTDGRSDLASAESRIAGTRASSDGTLRNLDRDSDFARQELAAADRFRSDDPDVFSRQEIIRSEIDHNLAQKRIDTSVAVRDVKASSAKVDIDLLDIERRKADIAIDRAQKGLDALEIKAPHDGLLVYKRDWRGEMTRVGDSVWPGEPLAEIPDLATMEARIYVLEADAGGLAAGLPAKVTVEAHPGTEYAATVKKVDTLAKRRAGWVPVQYFGATLTVAATDPEIMKPGQRVRAELRLDAQADAISVPRNAVFEKDGKKIVYRLAKGKFSPAEVQLGAAAVGRVVVTSGLAPGDVIALKDPFALEKPAPAAGEAPGPVAAGGSR